MEIKIIKKPINKQELIGVAKNQFGDLIKAVVDIEQGIMAISGELHADEEVVLMEKEGSKREYTWGINLYPETSEGDWIEFDSMINLKPSYGNRSRNVDNPDIQKQIKDIVEKLVIK